MSTITLQGIKELYPHLTAQQIKDAVIFGHITPLQPETTLAKRLIFDAWSVCNYVQYNKNPEISGPVQEANQW